MHKVEVLLVADANLRLFRQFTDCVEEITVYDLDQVQRAIARVEHGVMSGYHAMGFITYEAAAGFDSTLPRGPQSELPLLWFALFRQERLISLDEWCPPGSFDTTALSGWQPTVSEPFYRESVDKIKSYISQGDCYQVNLTFDTACTYGGSARHCFRQVFLAQPTEYACFIDLGRYSIISASPELFFRCSGNTLVVKPMKGTAKRGRWLSEDSERISVLQSSAKERAENLMIVDLLRNDLGRIAENGSVSVTALFEIETHRTVHQMTSTVSARMRTDVDLFELFRALFPCGSVTGAPKKRSMEVIRSLEKRPRGVYTGCIGYISPHKKEMLFNVAIRTVVLDRATEVAHLAVGSGITWDSESSAEYEECLAKTRFAASATSFHLIESLLFEPVTGYFLLDRHLQRLEQSAGYFGFVVDLLAIRERLIQHGQSRATPHKVRLVVEPSGCFSLEESELVPPPADTAWVTIAAQPVLSSDPFLFHKTTRREHFERAAAQHPECVDVLFVNERNEVTEGTYNNLVVSMSGALWTPPRESGLLPGTYRGYLLDSGIITERSITPRDLAKADALYLINSVRKWRRVYLVGSEDAQ